MKNIKYKGTTRVLGTAASLLLFLVFAICMIVIIGAGAGIYSRITGSYETTYGSSAAIRYVTNKIRACDSCKIIENGTGIILENDTISTVIYSGSGGIFERSFSAGSEVIPSGGELIVETDSLTVSDIGGLFEISVTCGKDSSSVLVRKGDTSGE